MNLNLNTYIGQELMKQQSNNSNPKRHNKLLNMNNFIILQINQCFLLARGRMGGKGIAFYNGAKMILQVVEVEKRRLFRFTVKNHKIHED